MAMSINFLLLPERVEASLDKAGISTLDELLLSTSDGLNQLGVPKTHVQQIQAALAANHFSLRDLQPKLEVTEDPTPNDGEKE